MVVPGIGLQFEEGRQRPVRLTRLLQEHSEIEQHGATVFSPQGRGAGERRKWDQSILSNSEGGRNERLCTAE